MSDDLELERATEILAESEKLFREMAECINDVVWMTDPSKGQMIYISQAYETIWGGSCEELYRDATKFVEAIDPRDRARVIAAFPEQEKGTYAVEYRIIQPDGSQRWIKDRAFPVTNEDGQVYRLVGLAEDITERKDIEREIEEKNRLLEDLSTKLSRYLSPQVYESIFSGEQDVAISTNRKKLTVFFSDIKDFTATTENLEPEELTFLLNDYLTEMTGIALEHGATIDKYIGDAMLLFLGDPTTKGVEEDALACVRMAIAMQRRMVELRAKWRDLGHERPIHMRIGINTGYCNVGNFGSDIRMDYTIIGGEVNLAARLEGIAEPDGIMMAYETYALVKHEIDAEEQDAIKVKGISRDIIPYAVNGIFDDFDADCSYIRSENDAMRLYVDLRKLDKKGRAATAKELEKCIEKLRNI